MALIDILWISLACLGSYLLGSIPFSVWIGRLVTGSDIRNLKTGNPGGFNAIKSYGLAIGFPIMFLDFLKGTATIALVDRIFSWNHFVAGDGSNFAHTFMCILGPALCILGHTYPVWLKFKGGQGLGAFIGIMFYANPLILTLFLVLFLLLVGLAKMKARVVGIITVLICIIPGLFLSMSPPWVNISVFWISSQTFIFPTQVLLIVAMDLALLVKLFQKLIFGSSVKEEKVLETRE